MTNNVPVILLNIRVDLIAEMIVFSSEIDNLNFFMELTAIGTAASEIKQKTGIMDIPTHPIIIPYEIIGKM